MELQFVTATAPSYWAPYLINGDPSGLEDDEIAAADAFTDGKLCIDAEEVGFKSFHDAWAYCPFAADCCEYTFQVFDSPIVGENPPR